MVQVTRKRVGEHKLIFLDVDGVFALLVKTHLNCEFGQRPQADERDDGVDVRILSLPFAFQHSKFETDRCWKVLHAANYAKSSFSKPCMEAWNKPKVQSSFPVKRFYRCTRGCVKHSQDVERIELDLAGARLYRQRDWGSNCTFLYMAFVGRQHWTWRCG